MAYGTEPFGLNQIKFVKDAAVVTLPAAQTMTFTPRLLGGELKGNDSIVAVGAAAEALEWSLENGGLPLDAIALVTGWTATESGSTPSKINTLTARAGTAFPYFKIYGKVLGTGGDDVHVKVFKAKLTGNIDGQFSYGEFYVVKMSGIAVDDGTALYQVVQNETAATLPTS